MYWNLIIYILWLVFHTYVNYSLIQFYHVIMNFLTSTFSIIYTANIKLIDSESSGVAMRLISGVMTESIFCICQYCAWHKFNVYPLAMKFYAVWSFIYKIARWMYRSSRCNRNIFTSLFYLMQIKCASSVISVESVVMQSALQLLCFDSYREQCN